MIDYVAVAVMQCLVSRSLLMSCLATGTWSWRGR